jgi:trimeric autotransporter adhesin
VNSSPAWPAIQGWGAQSLLGSGNGGQGIAGIGGNSNGTISAPDSGGAGVFAQGGNSVSEYDTGGKGVNAFGGTGMVEYADGGIAIVATGGNAGENGFGGAGIEAYGGNPLGEGIYASGASESYAGYFNGSVIVNATLSKASGSFQIDHPLDPANKYLFHSFVESSDMMNIYNGNAITDGSGTAVVAMPAWFEALNSDFRYQLTTIGQPAQAWVAQKITNGSFTIKTSKPGVEVSWQVTGIRQDAWANAHRIQVEVDKAPRDQGHYLHPELFGHQGEPNIGEMHHPRPEPVKQGLP